MEERIPRFCKTTRWIHWTFAFSFLALAISGALLLCREALQLHPETIQAIISLHLVFGSFLLLLPFTILLSGKTREALQDLRMAFQWHPEDLLWLILQIKSIIQGIPLPKSGKLNAGQKGNALLSIFLGFGMSITGFFLWISPNALLPWFIHLLLFFAWIPVFCGHIFLATINPATRHALMGMTQGWVNRSWAEHHHAAWVKELQQSSTDTPKNMEEENHENR